MKDIKKIDEDLKAAMREKNEDVLRTLRSVKTAIKNKEVDLIRELEEAECLQLLNTLVKQRRDSIEQFEKAGRKDLVDVEMRELDILESYLPPSLSDEELSKIIEEEISATGATTPKDMGMVMKAIKEKVVGRADGKKVSSLVVKFLQPKK